MIDSKTRDAMLAAGASAEVIVAAVKTELAKSDARRTENRDRMRAVRTRARTTAHVRARACTDQKHEQNHSFIKEGVGEEENNALSSSLTSLLTKEDKKERKKERKKDRAKSSLCSDDFLPSETHYAAGLALGLSRSEVDSLCGDMRDWSQSNAHRPVARKTDWGRAFHQWIKRTAEKPRGKTTVQDAARKLAAGGITFGPVPRGPGYKASVDPVRLLPEGGRERPGDLLRGDFGGIEPIPGRGGGVGDGSADGTPE